MMLPEQVVVGLVFKRQIGADVRVDIEVIFRLVVACGAGDEIPVRPGNILEAGRPVCPAHAIQFNSNERSSRAQSIMIS